MSTLADTLAKTIFENTKPKALVLGPDAFAIDAGDPGWHDDDKVLTIYDDLVNQLLAEVYDGESEERHNTHDLFLATELWFEKGRKQSELTEFHEKFFHERRDSLLPLIDEIASLPVQYYINFGFDPFLSDRVLAAKPYARTFNILLDEPRARWSMFDDIGTVEKPWVINLLGKTAESTTTYAKLTRLFGEILRPNFLHDGVKAEISTGAVMYVGMQLRYWYTRILMLSLSSDRGGISSVRRAFEMRSPPLEEDMKSIELYTANTSGIEMQVDNYEKVHEMLKSLRERFKPLSIFISHRHCENPRMTEIAERLADDPHLSVVTSHSFQRDAGEKWRKLQTSAIEKSNVYIQLLTQSMHSDRGSECWAEMDTATQPGSEAVIIPIVYDNLDIERVAPKLKDLESIDASKNGWLNTLLLRIADLAPEHVS